MTHTLTRSGSSGSSTGASETADRATGGKSLEPKVNKSFNSSLSDLSIESLDNTGQEEEDLLADCISSAMPKSKSEHFDLSGKSKSRSKKSPSPGSNKEAMSKEKSASSGAMMMRRERSSEQMLRREKSGSNLKSRSNSKSPRGSRLIPGVVSFFSAATDCYFTPSFQVIPELRLKPRSRPGSQEIKEVLEVKEVKVVRRDEKNQEVREVMEVKEILPQRSEKVQETKMGKEINLTGSQTSSEGPSSSSVGPSSINMCSLTASGLTEAGLVAKALSLSQQSECCSEMGGPPSLIQDTQPPSLMQDSMPSLTLGQSLQGLSEAQVQGLRRPSVPSPSLQCRHTLSGKLGSSVPVAVRRALGDRAVGSASAEDLSSISSCHSNLDNIQPPTLLEELDMDCSLLSVASLPSEAGAILVASGGSTDSASASITSEAIRDMVVPAGDAVRDFQDSSIISAPHLTQSSVSVDLAMVAPPSAMEELTLTANTGTLVADVKGGTFLVGGQEENNDTIADVPDAFDDEETVNEPTLTVGSEGQVS